MQNKRLEEKIKHNSKEDFLKALKIVGSDNPIFDILIDTIKKLGRNTILVRSIERPPRLSRKDFEKRLPEIKQRVQLLRISAKDVPQNYEEHLILEELAEEGRGVVKKYSVKYPEDMQPHEIGLCPISTTAHDFFPPGLHLAGYAREIIIEHHSKGQKNSQV